MTGNWDRHEDAEISWHGSESTKKASRVSNRDLEKKGENTKCDCAVFVIFKVWVPGVQGKYIVWK